ncbi:MAG: hypothetical protein WKF31_02410 [Thermoleophilaceae bacterium]
MDVGRLVVARRKAAHAVAHLDPAARAALHRHAAEGPPVGADEDGLRAARRRSLGERDGDEQGGGRGDQAEDEDEA